MPSEGGLKHLAECGEPFAVVAAEDAEGALGDVESGELSDHLNSEDFGVGEHRGGAALADTIALDSVVYDTEDGSFVEALISMRSLPLRRSLWPLPGARRTSRHLEFYKMGAQGVTLDP